jgi:hypothetical protein
VAVNQNTKTKGFYKNGNNCIIESQMRGRKEREREKGIEREKSEGEWMEKNIKQLHKDAIMCV